VIISFAWTTPALLAGAKTVTRREWSPMHAARFHAGDLVDAYDKSPRAQGHKVATIRIARDPYQQRTSKMHDVGEYEREGIRWLALNGLRPPGDFFHTSWADWWHAWKAADLLVWVVEFELVEVVVPPPPAKKRSSRPPDIDHGRSFS
jgi:hypothetical protein